MAFFGKWIDMALRLMVIGFLLVFWGCSGSYRESEMETPSAPSLPSQYKTTLNVRDESGLALNQVTVRWETQSVTTDNQGNAILTGLPGPRLVHLEAPGFFEEWQVVGWENADQVVSVTLWQRLEGSRWVMHNAGDTMFGRRFQNPSSGAAQVPLADAGPGAQSVVHAIQPIFSNADFRTLNLETTVTTQSETNAYPGKRFILNTPPAALTALKDLNVDLVILGNNHARDYLDSGIHDTLMALDDHQLVGQGAAENQVDSEEPFITTVASTRVGVLSWTTVNGAFVNDQYPPSAEEPPIDLPQTEAWQYADRLWGLPDAPYQIPITTRRIREVWDLFREKEDQLSSSEVAYLWASLVEVYPELQDWVSGRGHGGAAFWQNQTGTAAILALKAQVDLVIVQLHSGFQYQENPSESLRINARRAIDAGADLVVCHHPHVIQGLEYYRGHLIAYSLGNFVFDQDFLSTFSSCFLRTIWQGNTLVHAQLVPFQIIDYRPTPVSQAQAQVTLQRLQSLSLNQAESRRVDARTVRSFLVELTENDSLARIDPLSGSLQPGLGSEQHEMLNLAAQSQLALSGITHAQLGQPGDETQILVGKDLFGWGHCEDVLVDGRDEPVGHWALSSNAKQLVQGDAYQGRGFLRLERRSSDLQAVLVRPSARIPLPRHRVYDSETGLPADPDPSYSLEFAARLVGTAQVRIRVDAYLFDDADPTEDPESTLIQQKETVINLGNQWQKVRLDLDDFYLVAEGQRANMVNFYFWLAPAQSATATLDVDAIQFIEWRAAGGMPDRFGAFDWVRNTSNEPKQVVVKQW
ncbi:MAG: CapA family protein [Acidobacteria bacterium]|nr:CapA family protein [Acidobacteriota bacterium]